MITFKSLKRDQETLAFLGINVSSIVTSQNTLRLLAYRRPKIIDELNHIRNGLKSGNDDVIYDFCDSCIFKKSTLLRGLDLKRNSNYICPSKICSEFHKKPDMLKAFIQRLDIIHEYLTTTG